MTDTMIIQLVMALLGSLGFSLYFKLRPVYCATAAIGGLLTWGVYLILFGVCEKIFVACFVASVFGALYSEVFAKIHKAPTTLLLIPSIVPLVPGSALYYTMRSIVSSDISAALDFARITLEFSLSIALGVSTICTFWALFFKNRKRKSKD